MEKINYLPLGSIVLIKGGLQKLLGVAALVIAGDFLFTDYGSYGVFLIVFFTLHVELPTKI